MATQGSQTRSPLDLPLVSGAVAGVVTFLAGYALTFLVKSGDISELLTRSLGEAQGSGITPPGDWQVVGWFFFQTHTVATETVLTIGGQSQTTTTSGRVESWMLLVPVALLVSAGFVVARQSEASDALGGARAGATVVSGYLVLAVGAAVLVTWSASVSGLGGTASLSIGPPMLTGILTVGIVYPLGLGAVGGAIGSLTGR
jgi:hypothetical protein